MLIGFLLSDISIFMTCFSIPKEYLLSSFKRTKTFLCFFMLNNLSDEKSKKTLKVDQTITKISRGIKWIQLWNNLFFASSLAKILIVTDAIKLPFIKYIDIYDLFFYNKWISSFRLWVSLCRIFSQTKSPNKTWKFSYKIKFLYVEREEVKCQNKPNFITTAPHRKKA